MMGIIRTLSKVYGKCAFSIGQTAQSAYQYRRLMIIDRLNRDKSQFLLDAVIMSCIPQSVVELLVAELLVAELLVVDR
jgi:hypothetical protein